MSQHFSKTPTEARQKFLAACAAAHIGSTPFQCPATIPAGAGKPGAGDEGSGQSWWIDVARLGSPDATRVAVLCCGLNGAEGYCGSGVLISWLAENRQQELPRDVAVVLVHGVNPGPLIATGPTIGPAAAPQEVASIGAAPPARGWTDKVLAAAERRFMEYAKKNSSPTDAANNPRSANIWIEKIFESIGDIVTKKATHAALVEFHTDFSEASEVSIYSCHKAGSIHDGRIAEWFGSVSGTQSDGPAVADALLLNLERDLGGADLTAMVVEFGVYSTRSILAIDPPKNTTDRRERYQRLFYPESAAWRENAAKEARSIIRRVAQGLEAL
ncbi:MAG: DUF2817 domain-containing protein [Rhodospirillaceae bacterium]|nr:DUF2817 domain-containing protein [Rhodospirillaceae bacterium]MBT5665238.1 DUF2817 domain-containing protein [Rhodospirillaceae bacterium]MBT5809589.1 DUF2817 domain-containing protein [Rhodospirillaceae bacterium]